MSNKVKTSNNKNESGIFLDTTRWTHEWEEILSKLPSAARTGPWPIHLVLPIPEFTGSLVVYEQGLHSYHGYTTLTTLYHDEPMMTDNYVTLRRTLPRLPYFQKRRHPMINLPHVLFPLNDATDSIWINPLMIEEVWEETTVTYIKIASGPGIIVSTREATIKKYAENALMALACSQRDLNPNVRSFRSNNPLNYLDLPETPFIQELARRRWMQSFPIPEGLYRELFYTQMGAHKMLKDLKSFEESKFTYNLIQRFIDEFK